VELLAESWRYVQENPERVREAVVVHVQLCLAALGLAIAIFVPIGVVVSRSGRVGASLLGAVAAVRVVPSLAALFLLYSVMGTGFRPALLALTLLAGPPIVINTDAGLRNVDAAVLENARGLGMNPFQVFARVQAPIALPVAIAGVRSAAVEIVSSAALAAFIGVRGLGIFITSGLTLNRYEVLLVGAIPVTLMALLAESGLGLAERLLTPPTA
jgi:osmoprotectant transport system permease protein